MTLKQQRGDVMGRKRLIECHDLPTKDAFCFLVENPLSEIVGRVSRRVDDNGDVWTYLDSGGNFGFRVELWDFPENRSQGVM